MANYNVTGNKIKFTDPMLVNGNLPDEPQDDALDPVAQYRQEQMRQLEGQGAAPSGKPDLANPHPESMAGIKAANGGQIPDHLQRKGRPVPDNLNPRWEPKGYVDDMGPFAGAGADEYDRFLRSKNPPSSAASRPGLPDAGTASTAYDGGDSNDESDSDVMPWAGNPQMRTPSNVGAGSGSDSDSDSEIPPPWEQIDYNRIASNVGQESEQGVTPVEPDTKNSDLAVNPGFTPYYESETGKDVKEQGRQRLQEYLQKLAGRGKQHEERLAHDNGAAGAKARNDFGALLMDSASMVGTLGGKRADTTQLAKFPGKLYQADMAPSRSAMMYENAEDKDAKAVADIGDREDRNDISRQKLYDGLMSRREANKQRDADEAGRNARNKENIASREKIAGLKPGAVKTGEIGPSGDEILSKDDQRIWDKLQTDTNTARAPRNSPQGRNQQTIDAAGRMLVLYDQGLDQKNGLTPTQMTEIATAAASLIGGNGTSSAQAQIEHLTPQTAGRTSAQIEQWLKNEPAGAKQMEFAKQFMDTALREGHQASENIKDGQTDSYMSSTLWDRAPKRMEDSYYRTVGDDAAYDESGRYVREPYVKLPDNRSSKAKNPQDADDEAWGKQHGLTFEQAKVIRDRRRAGNGGK